MFLNDLRKSDYLASWLDDKGQQIIVKSRILNFCLLLAGRFSADNLKHNEWIILAKQRCVFTNNFWVSQTLYCEMRAGLTSACHALSALASLLLWNYNGRLQLEM